jgi:hypothetical protein
MSIQKIKVGGASVKTTLKLPTSFVSQLSLYIISSAPNTYTHTSGLSGGNLLSGMGPDPTSKQPAAHHPLKTSYDSALDVLKNPQEFWVSSKYSKAILFR